jgi:hypothetical protein
MTIIFALKDLAINGVLTEETHIATTCVLGSKIPFVVSIGVLGPNRPSIVDGFGVVQEKLIL